MHGPLFVCVRQGTVLPMPKLCADPSVPYFPTPFAVGANTPDEPCVLQPFQPRAYRFFATAWRSASCDTVEPGSSPTGAKIPVPDQSPPKTLFSCWEIPSFWQAERLFSFLLPQLPIKLVRRASPCVPTPFPLLCGALVFFAGPLTLPLGCFQTFCRDTSRVPCGPFPALQQAPDRRTCHGQKMEEILDRARTCALFL